MTVCIAGACRDQKEPRIVFCSDKRIGTEVAGGDVCMKWDHVGDGWMALLAGTVSKARSLAGMCRKILSDHAGEADSNTVSNLLRKAAQLQRCKLVDDYVHSQLALSYQYFLKHGKEQLPDSVFSEVVFNVRTIQLDCSLIVAGFVRQPDQMIPTLFTIETTGEVRKNEAFSVIGCGQSVAESWLFRKLYKSDLDIAQAAYMLFEAKRLSEVSGDVGPSTDMGVLRPSPTVGYIGWKSISPVTKARFERRFKELHERDYEPLVLSSQELAGLRFKEGQADPQSTITDQSPPPPSPESPGGSGES